MMTIKLMDKRPILLQAFLELESYGLLYKKLLTGEDNVNYLENNTL